MKCFWPRFHIVVLGMTFFFLSLYPLIYFPYSIWTFISLFYLDFYFPFLFGLLIPFSIWTFNFPFLFGLLSPFSGWTFISLLYLDFYFPFIFRLLFPISIWTFLCFKFIWNLFEIGLKFIWYSFWYSFEIRFHTNRDLILDFF